MCLSAIFLYQKSMIVSEKYYTDKKIDDFFGEKMMILYGKIEIGLKNQNLKKKNCLRR